MFSTVDGFRYNGINVANGYIATFSSYTQFFTSIPTSDGSNLYLGGAINTNITDSNIVWVKINNSHSARITVEKELGTINYDSGLLCDVDSGGNVYIVGVSDVGNSQTAGEIAKFSSTGTLDWKKQLVPSPGIFYADYTDVDVESGGANIYASGKMGHLYSEIGRAHV